MSKPLVFTSTDRDIAARTLSGEADDQGRAGKIAVAWVLRNRMEWTPSAWWGSSLGKVCQLPWQFSCWLPGADHDRIVAMQTSETCYVESLEVIDQVMAGLVPDPTGGSTTYKVRGTPASWDHAVEAQQPMEIGDHDFWCLAPNGTVLKPIVGDGIGGTDKVIA